MSKKRIYVVDDDPKIGELFATVLRRDGYDARHFTAPQALLEVVDGGDAPDLILADLMMPGMTGTELLQAIRDRDLALPLIIMTAHSSVQTAVEAMRMGAFHYLQKPVNLEEMRTLLAKALDLYADRQELRQIKRERKQAHDLEKIQGTSAEIQEVRDTVDALRDVPNTIVLIRGETGTGKNLVAKTIHYHSAWNAGRFLEINCAALPDNLLESELFGYEKGAFTDARAAKPGLLELADGGTLFLDEIDSMSLTLQAKLLQFLESRTFRRLGGTEDLKVTTRILCATNAALEERVAKKEFRKDLFFRINVVALHLPALRTMGPDVLSIARGIVRQFNAELKRDVEGFTPEAERKLLAHDWPGNVRELRNVLERAMIFARGTKLDVGDLLLLSTEGFEDGAQDGYFRFRAGGTLEDLEHAYIRHTLTESNTSYAEVARILGISKKTLWEKRKKYQLDEQPEETE
jgi:two-component system, NtrC family, response regulator AtoC